MSWRWNDTESSFEQVEVVDEGITPAGLADRLNEAEAHIEDLVAERATVKTLQTERNRYAEGLRRIQKAFKNQVIQGSVNGVKALDHFIEYEMFQNNQNLGGVSTKARWDVNI